MVQLYNSCLLHVRLLEFNAMFAKHRASNAPTKDNRNDSVSVIHAVKDIDSVDSSAFTAIRNYAPESSRISPSTAPTPPPPAG